MRASERSATTESGAASGQRMPFPTTLHPRTRSDPVWRLLHPELFSLFSEEPHRVTSQRPCGLRLERARPEGVGDRPHGWRLSHDVATRLKISSRGDSFSPANRLHPHYQRANPSISRASPFASVVDNNHHSFTYAASVAERNGLKPYGRNPPDHGLKPRGLRRVQTVTGAGGKQSSLSRSADLSDRFWILLRAGAIAPVPRISTKSGPFSPGEWLESLPGSARGY